MTKLNNPRNFVWSPRPMEREGPVIAPRHLPRHERGEKFLKGPVPLYWLEKAACLPGRSCQVAIALWFLAGLTQSNSVPLKSSLLRSFGVDRAAKYRAIKWLESKDLISVKRHKGRNPIVTILDGRD